MFHVFGHAHHSDVLNRLFISGLLPTSRMPMEKRHQIAGASLGLEVNDHAATGPATRWNSVIRQAP